MPASPTSDSLPPPPATPPSGPIRGIEVAGLILIRLVIPLWILSGALFKLAASDPGLLPRETVLTFGSNLDWDLDRYLAVLITIEILLASVMILLPRLARPAAIAQLAVFVAVLFGEMAGGNFADCGCLGQNSPPPWVMLTIDCILLIGACVLPMPKRRTRGLWVRGLLIGLITGSLGTFAWQRAIAPVVVPPEATSFHTPFHTPSHGPLHSPEPGSPPESHLPSHQPHPHSAT